MKIRRVQVVIIGRISKNEEPVRLEAEIHCNSCGKKVPGWIKAGSRYCQTKSFRAELEGFKRSYLCGICRDKKRTVRQATRR